MEWKDWSNVLFTQRSRLPIESGIYIVADANNKVWYVGKAQNIKSRWAGKTHHRYPQLIRSNRKLCHRIYWKLVPLSDLDEQEKYYVNLLQPELNGCKVKKYLPKQPMVEREIKRLLKVFNKPIFFAPIVRSVVIGKYENDCNKKCFIIVIPHNDFQIIYKSTKKRYATQARNAWIEIKTYCGLDENLYKPYFITTYNYYNYRFEFLRMPQLINYLNNEEAVRNKYINTIEFFSAQVKALKKFRYFESTINSSLYQLPQAKIELSCTNLNKFNFNRTYFVAV
ncbi:MAG: GIY-YIG nuclease family protein [Cyanobacteria bacterium J06635_10]